MEDIVGTKEERKRERERERERERRRDDFTLVMTVYEHKVRFAKL
jgi:hypothetical protein